MEGSMKIPSVIGAAAMTCGLVLLAAPSFAHHSFAAEFDANNCKDFTGTLTKLDWQSPHPYFYMDIKDASGKVEKWSFETYAPITLRRNGTDRQVFMENIGKEVWVRGCLARNRKLNYAAAGTLKFADGVLRQVGQIQD
jgi:Family of unknown function (DUF6152)